MSYIMYIQSRGRTFLLHMVDIMADDDLATPWAPFTNTV